MIIGAIAALISGATFSAFTDSATVTGSITAGNVQVDTNDTTTLVWNLSETCPASTPTTVIGSGDSCTSTVPVDYTGNLPASMSLLLTWEESTQGCFTVDASFGTTEFVSGEGSQLSLEVAAAADGVVTVTVGLPEDAPNSCQSATISLTLTVTTTEIT
jgi:predicted ribosomally synthesized peptide with SipW-like signal peptide